MAAERALIIIPTYNERENLPAIIAAVESVVSCDFLVVDDNSPDGTGQIADEIAARDPRVKVMHRQGKLGLGTAYVAGFGRAPLRANLVQHQRRFAVVERRPERGEIF